MSSVRQYVTYMCVCVYVCVVCRLVKQLAEASLCHVTTLKLAGNSLQVHS